MTIDQNPSTRMQILTMLRKSGALSANDIARQLGITDIAVRRHLNNLERDRVIRAETVRQSMGRPTFVYSLTEQAEELFPKHYAGIALDMLNDILDMHGPEYIDVLFERREGRLEQKYNSLLKDKRDLPLESLVDALSAIQNERGYMAEWRKEETGDGVRYFILEHNCPIHDVAHRFNQACSSELSLFRKVLDAEVDQLECKAKGGERCVYAVKARRELANAKG